MEGQRRILPSCDNPHFVYQLDPTQWLDHFWNGRQVTSPGEQGLPALAKAGLLFPGLVEPPTSAQQLRLQRNDVLQLYTPEESVIYTSLIEVRVRHGITLTPAELQRQNEQWYFTPWMYFCTPLDPLTSDGQSLQVPHVLTGQHFPHNEGHVNFHLSPRSAALMHFFGVWLKIEASLPDGQALREEALHRPVVLWALRMPQQELFDRIQGNTSRIWNRQYIDFMVNHGDRLHLSRQTISTSRAFVFGSFTSMQAGVSVMSQLPYFTTTGQSLTHKTSGHKRFMHLVLQGSANFIQPGARDWLIPAAFVLRARRARL